MTDSHIVPQDKFDLAAVERAGNLENSQLIPHYAALLEWVQDANWPVAGPVAQLLAQSGPEIVPHISAVLRTDDDFWQQWILDLIVRHLNTDIRMMLKPDLDRLVYDGVTPDVRELSQEMLSSHL